MDAIQLYTLRDLDVSVDELFTLVADAGFDGVEYAYRVPEADPETVRAALARTGLDVPAAHVPIDDVEEDPARTVERYREIECERFVVPYLGEECFESRAAVAETADRLDALAARLADHDVELAYHNHTTEFRSVGDETAFDVLAAESDGVGFELDVGLTAATSTDPVSVLERYGDRIDLLHCTDTDPEASETEHARFGTGAVDYDAVFDAAEDAGVEWYVYENGSTSDQRAELDHAAEAFVGR